MTGIAVIMKINVAYLVSFSKQRRATRKEVRELEELVESELKDARTTLNIQVGDSYQIE